eukprot:jgi/Hompol1/2201/HPOL_005887-RA
MLFAVATTVLAAAATSVNALSLSVWNSTTCTTNLLQSKSFTSDACNPGTDFCLLAGKDASDPICQFVLLTTNVKGFKVTENSNATISFGVFGTTTCDATSALFGGKSETVACGSCVGDGSLTNNVVQGLSLLATCGNAPVPTVPSVATTGSTGAPTTVPTPAKGSAVSLQSSAIAVLAVMLTSSLAAMLAL